MCEREKEPEKCMPLATLISIQTEGEREPANAEQKDRTQGL